MSAMTSQITGVSIDCWAVCLGADQRKNQSSASLAFVRGIHAPVTGEFSEQRVSNAGNVSIWWRHHAVHTHTAKWVPETRFTTATWRCRKPISQWQCSLHLKAALPLVKRLAIVSNRSSNTDLWSPKTHPGGQNNHKSLLKWIMLS